MFYSRKRKPCHLIIEYESFSSLVPMRRRGGQEGKGAGKKIYRHLVKSLLAVENFNEDKLYKFPNRKFKGVWWMP